MCVRGGGKRGKLLVHFFQGYLLNSLADLLQAPNSAPTFLRRQLPSLHCPVRPGHLGKHAPLRRQWVFLAPPLWPNDLCCFSVRAQRLVTLTGANSGSSARPSSARRICFRYQSAART